MPTSTNIQFIFENTDREISKNPGRCWRKTSCHERTCKKFYDWKLNAQTYVVGDSVYLQKNTKTSKVDSEYSGPHKIVRIFNDYNVELDLGKEKSKIFHMNRLRPQSKSSLIQKSMIRYSIIPSLKNPVSNSPFK